MKKATQTRRTISVAASKIQSQTTGPAQLPPASAIATVSLAKEASFALHNLGTTVCRVEAMFKALELRALHREPPPTHIDDINADTGWFQLMDDVAKRLRADFETVSESICPTKGAS